MPTESPTWGQKLKGFLSNDALPVALGMGAQAAMEEHRTSWPALLGKSVVDLQRSNIASKAAKRQATERNALKGMLAKLLSGQGLSEQGVPGPTTTNLTVNPDGTQALKITGDKMFGPEGATRSQPTASPPPAAKGAAPGAVSPTQLTSPRSSLLPFYLAQSGGSSGGAGQSLAGLTPEQISNITTQDIAGGELMNRSIAEIFNNMQKQSNAGYLDNLGTAAVAKNRGAGDLVPFQTADGRTFNIRRQDVPSMYGHDVTKQWNAKKSGFETARINLQALRTQAENAKDYKTVQKLDAQIEELDQKVFHLDRAEAVRSEEDIIGYYDEKGNHVKPEPKDISRASIDRFNDVNPSNYVYVQQHPEEDPIKVTLPEGVKGSGVFRESKLMGISTEEYVDRMKQLLGLGKDEWTITRRQR